MERFSDMQVFSIAHAAYTRREGATEFAFNRPDRAARYIVGGIATKVIPHDTAGYASAVLTAAIDLASEGFMPETIGVWHDDGLAYIDLGDTYSSLDLALNIAQQRGELAIWDRETNSEIRVDNTSRKS